MTEQTLIVSSRSNPHYTHEVIYDPETHYVRCTCPAFRYRGRCSHIRFFKETIKEMNRENECTTN